MICCFETRVVLVQQQPRRWLTCYYSESKTGSTSMDTARKVNLKLPGHSESFQNGHIHDANDDYKSDFVGTCRFVSWHPRKILALYRTNPNFDQDSSFHPPSPFCLPSSLIMFYILEFQSNCGACGSLPPHSSPSYVTPLHITCSAGTS